MKTLALVDYSTEIRELTDCVHLRLKFSIRQEVCKSVHKRTLSVAQIGHPCYLCTIIVLDHPLSFGYSKPRVCKGHSPGPASLQSTVKKVGTFWVADSIPGP